MKSIAEAVVLITGDVLEKPAHRFFVAVIVNSQHITHKKRTKTGPIFNHKLSIIKGLKMVLGGSMKNQKIKSDSNNIIGKNIREARQKAQIGQTELVSRLQLLDVKMTRETLVKIERGVQHIQLEQLKGIKEVLNVSYEELLD